MQSWMGGAILGEVVARTNKSRAPALAYLRTSSAANVGTDKDSEKRQRQSVEAFARRGVRLLTSSGDDLTASDDPTRKIMRQIAGAFAEYEKARLVSKLRHARERVRNERGKCEGRKSHAELHPDVVAEAKRLRRASPKTGARLSYRKISQKLAASGFVNEKGRPFNPKSIRAMAEQ
jgi:hypothetical protein